MLTRVGRQFTEMFFHPARFSFLHSAGLPRLRRPAKVTEIDLFKAPTLKRSTRKVTLTATKLHVPVHGPGLWVDPVLAL